jgi:addiction module RelE/StbE family toxin
VRIRWSQSASIDFASQIAFIHADRPRAADRIGSLILDRIEALSAHPHRGRIGRLAGTRELVVAPFVIVYEMGATGDIIVVRVLHGRQNWPEDEE